MWSVLNFITEFEYGQVSFSTKYLLIHIASSTSDWSLFENCVWKTNVLWSNKGLIKFHIDLNPNTVHTKLIIHQLSSTPWSIQVINYRRLHGTFRNCLFKFIWSTQCSTFIITEKNKSSATENTKIIESFID